MNARGARAVVGGAALLLTSCVAPTPEPVGEVSRFATALAEQYDELSATELAEYDWRDADVFQARADAARQGRPSEPEAIEFRDLAPDDRMLLDGRRRSLIDALDRGGRILAPNIAARSQAGFDCWMQEQEEGTQPADIAACRDAFEATLAELEAALDAAVVVLLADRDSGTTGAIEIAGDAGTLAITTPLKAITARAEAAPAEIGVLSEQELEALFGDALAAAPPLVKFVTLYFETGSDQLTEESEVEFAAVVEEAAAREAARVTIFGHTDTVGRAEVNVRLAAARARTIAERLIESGQAADSVAFESYGESRPLVPTPDNTPEPRNRRVEVIIR